MATKKKTATKKATATAKAKPSKKKSVSVANGTKFQELPISLIVSADNVRTERTDISDLAESIKAHGIINPITVHPDGKRRFFIVVAGHRRLEAAKFNKLVTVPCNIIEGQDKNILNEIAIQENVLRVDMTPYEECVAIKNLVGKGNTPRQIAARFGRTLRWVLVRVKLANAGDKVLNKVKDGSIRMANAAKLADLPDDEFNKEMNSVYRLDDYTTKIIIDRHHMDLKKAPFDICDCSTCSKCSAQQQDLFAEETENYCLDPDCWAKKCHELANAKKDDYEKEGVIATVGDDDYRVHRIESWQTEKLEQAEQAGIKKRVVIDPETCKEVAFYDERDLPDFHEETEEEREQRHNEECRIKRFNKVKDELYCKNLSGAICTVTARNLGNHLITLLMFAGNEWFLKFAQENSWIDENEYNVYPENFKEQKTIEEIVDVARNNINRIIEDFDADSLTAIFRMMFKDIDPETLRPFDYEVTAEIERQQAEENKENSDEDDD